MKKENTVVSLQNPAENIQDALTELAREGARQMLMAAMDAEVNDFLEQHAEHRTNSDHQRFVRNGYLPARTVQTGIGDVPIQQPRVRDREPGEPDAPKFRSSLIPPYLRRSKSIEKLLPLLYLRGISTGDFQSVLEPILGKEAKNVSHSTISRLKASWHAESEAWKKQDLALKKYVYWWADGIYLQARMEDASSCVLVIIGVTDKGKKELIAIEDGFRESKVSWQALMRDLKERGLTYAPKVAVGDGALGFWAALEEEFSMTRHQRCWVHKTANVLNRLPKSLQAKAKSQLQEIWMSDTKEHAEKAFQAFVDSYQLKYPKAVECLEKDKTELLTFYDFPAEHWKPLRTTNPIESTFATVRHRTKRCKGCFSRETILTMVFKLCQSAELTWNRLKGFNRLADVISGVKFVNGMAHVEKCNQDQTDAA